MDLDSINLRSCISILKVAETSMLIALLRKNHEKMRSKSEKVDNVLEYTIIPLSIVCTSEDTTKSRCKLSENNVYIYTECMWTFFLPFFPKQYSITNNICIILVTQVL